MISITVNEESEVGAARRTAIAEAEKIGLSAEDIDRLAIVVTEAGTNLVRHATAGEILIATEKAGNAQTITITALDEGPGIANVEAAMVDGYTTSTTERQGIGGGLGSMQRLADHFDIFSGTHGTVLVARIGKKKRVAGDAYDVAGLIVPKPGFDAGGDICAVHSTRLGTKVMLMDVLGHGPKAADIAELGRQAFDEAASGTLEEIEQHVGEALAGSRGAAALFVELPPGSGTARAMGLGNIKGDVIHADGTFHGIPSQPGIIGSAGRRTRVTEHDWPENAILLMSTDGLKTNPRVPEPNALYFRGAEMIAATLYKLRRRGSDDAGVLVVRSPH